MFWFSYFVQFVDVFEYRKFITRHCWRLSFPIDYRHIIRLYSHVIWKSNYLFCYWIEWIGSRLEHLANSKTDGKIETIPVQRYFCIGSYFLSVETAPSQPCSPGTFSLSELYPEAFFDSYLEQSRYAFSAIVEAFLTSGWIRVHTCQVWKCMWLV